MKSIKNIAIIAHVDHGKTTLVDKILHHCNLFRSNESTGDLILDNNDLERERGITILSKNVAVVYKNVKINIIDTPGHADFGGEVERVLGMADGGILLVDSAEGPMPQTKFVLGKALKLGLRPIVIVNKIDRQDKRPDEVVNEIFDLFVSLDANDEQLDFPILYASGRSGWCVNDLDDESRDLQPLMSLIVDHVPEPMVDEENDFAMLATLLDYDSYLGRCLTGKVISGNAKINDSVKAIDLNSTLIENGRLTKLFKFEGTKKVPVDQVFCGDIICIAGLTKASVSDTICNTNVTTPLKSSPIDPPTMSVIITINDSPFAGRDGKKVTSTVIRERLIAESKANVAITFSEADGKESFEIGGRGELQLGVLIETMRREGFELTVSRPKVLYKLSTENEKLEPIEEVTIDVDEEYSSSVLDNMNRRKGDMVDMRSSGEGKARIIFHAPSRALIGFQNKFLTLTKGTGVINRVFYNYGPYKGDIDGRRNGVLISTETGSAVAYALFNLQDRGIMFVGPQAEVYEGMIVGEHNRDNDLGINVLKGKKHSNVRSSGADEAVILVPHQKMSLEQMMAYIEDDELLEVTPNNLRLRKRYLDPNERKKMSKV